MKKKNAPAVLTPAADRYLKRTALLVSALPLALEIVILFPLTQIIAANLGDGVLYQILSVASRILNLAGYFAAISLAVYCVFADALSALGRVFALQSIFHLVCEVILRTFLLWLLALINDSLRPVIALSNYTLGSLTENNGLELFASALYDFLNVVTMIVLLAVIIVVALVIRRKLNERTVLESLVPDESGKSHRGILLGLRLATLVYLIQALANQIYSTFVSLEGVDTAALISSIGLIAAPYFLLAIYAFAGYWEMLTLAQRFADRTLALCSSGADR